MLSRRLLPTVLASVAVIAAMSTAPAAADDDEYIPHVWVYSGTQNFRHASIPHAKEVLAALAASTGAFTVEFTENPLDLTAAMLARTDVALFLSPSGIVQPGQVAYVNSENAPFSAAQRAAFVGWVQCGGGFIAVHQAADSYDDWPEWNELVGARFLLHPIWTSNPRAVLRVAAQAHPATAPWHGMASFELAEEYYAWRPGDTPDKLTSDFAPLLRLTRFTDPAVDATWGAAFQDDQPLAWTSTFRGKNRSFYTNLGHSDSTWDRPDFRAHIVNGLDWVAQHRVDRVCVAAG